MDIYIGTYTEKGSSEGIYRCVLDEASGALSFEGLAAEAKNPSYIAADAKGKVIYAVSETSPASVISYEISKNGGLKKVDEVETGGSAACHVSVSPTRGQVYAANYGDGSVMSCPVTGAGMFGRYPKTISHSGSSADPDRQSSPHAHSANVDPTGKWLFVADLGIDKIIVYEIESSTGDLLPRRDADGDAEPGSGPRHLAFHPGLDVVFCVNELSSAVTVFTIEAGGKLERVQTVPGLPGDFDGVSHAADIHVHPNGRFLYASNRGHDSIAVFAVSKTGRLSVLDHASTGGKTPRNFTLAAGGRYLIAANQDSDNLVGFEIGEDGIPRPNGCVVTVPSPSCVLPV